VPTAKTKYTPSTVVDVYRLATEGLTDAQIAGKLGVAKMTFADWKKYKPEVCKALADGRAGKEQLSEQRKTFAAFVYGRLPPHLQVVWDEVGGDERGRNGRPLTDEELDEYLTGDGVKDLQRLYVHCLMCSHFNPSEARRRLGLSLAQVRAWHVNDPEFERLLEEIPEIKKDFIEGSLFKLIAGGDTSATLFAARTQLRDRGYNDKLTIEGNHTHTVVSVDVKDVLKDMPAEAQRELLEAIRRNKASAAPALREAVVTNPE
jgi:hypothetical protein